MTITNRPDRLHIGYVTDGAGVRKPVMKRYALKVSGRYVTDIEFKGMTAMVEKFSVSKLDAPPLNVVFGTDSIALAMTASEQIQVLLDSELQGVTVEILDTWEERK